jgi:pyruvate dehydrogenase E1 component
VPFYRPPEDSPEMKYLKERRMALGGSLPQRRRNRATPPLEIPGLDLFKTLLEPSGEREISTTMVFVRALMTLTRDKALKPHLVPIVADEARTFGMEGMFRQLGIYSSVGQLYDPVDAGQLAPYIEAKNGQILEEGITEAGSLCSWMAAGTSHSNHGVRMIPFYIFYSMFGYQRVGDFVWAAGDMRTRGFLLGGTSGRTTLNGEGLQHQDGHGHLLFSVVPNCVCYDPCYAYELVVILQDGLRRMYAEDEQVFYYITVMNENYTHPAMPAGVEDGIRRGMYLLRRGAEGKKHRVQLLGSGTILREVEAAAQILEEQFDTAASVWSVTSFSELRRDGLAVDRWNRLHPEQEPRTAYVTDLLRDHEGPVIASTDYMKSYGDQIRPWIEAPYVVLGTDGYGRSDTRAALRRFFEVDRAHVALAALEGLAEAGDIERKALAKAIEKLGIDPEAPNPATS